MPAGIVIIKNPKITNVGEGVGKLESLYVAGENIRWFSTWEKSLAVLQKVKQRTTIWPSSSAPRSYPREWETDICVSMFVEHCSQEPRGRNNPLSTDRWIDKENVAYTRSGVLYSHEKEWMFVICSSMSGPRKNYAQWNKPGTEWHMLYDSTCMKHLE